MHSREKRSVPTIYLFRVLSSLFLLGDPNRNHNHGTSTRGNRTHREGSPRGRSRSTLDMLGVLEEGMSEAPLPEVMEVCSPHTYTCIVAS